MAKLVCETKGGARPNGRPRVLFTCHHEDFEKYYPSIKRDLFEALDCAIYHTESVGAILDTADIESMNLVVVPVTLKLLTTSSRAMDLDVPEAIKRHVPVLPLMMETGLVGIYSRKKCFGTIQYLSPISNDPTEIPYRDKLKRYLESVLVSDEMAKRVRTAFDAYIFLSYRKKDRARANELMRLIHSDPALFDVAVWYDEFLTPGESFDESIERALLKSDLFALLVTPSLLEESDGKPNFVVSEEYPAAKRAQKKVIPAEMVKTDRKALSETFEDLPECIEASDTPVLHKCLVEALKREARSENDSDPTHSFLIGLAYLEGIDVELDRIKGLALVKSSAEAGLVEAQERLFYAYSDGVGVDVDRVEACRWGELMIESYKSRDGENAPSTLDAMRRVGDVYRKNKDYMRAIEISMRAYAIKLVDLGEDHPDTVISFNDFVTLQTETGFGQENGYLMARESGERALKQCLELFGEESLPTLVALKNLTESCDELDDRAATVEYGERAWKVACALLGDSHPHSLMLQRTWSRALVNRNEDERCLEVRLEILEKSRRIQGERHPDTLLFLHDVGLALGYLGRWQESLDTHAKALDARCEVLGRCHPDTLRSFEAVAKCYGKLERYPEKLKTLEEALSSGKERLGSADPRVKKIDEELESTLVKMLDLASEALQSGRHELSAQLYEALYESCVRNSPKLDASSLIMKAAYSRRMLGETQKALENAVRAHEDKIKFGGEDDPEAQQTLDELLQCLAALGRYEECLPLCERLWERWKELESERSENALAALSVYANYCREAGQLEKSAELFSRLYLTRREMHGENNIRTLTARHDLDLTLKMLGKE